MRDSIVLVFSEETGGVCLLEINTDQCANRNPRLIPFVSHDIYGTCTLPTSSKTIGSRRLHVSCVCKLLHYVQAPQPTHSTIKWYHHLNEARNTSIRDILAQISHCWTSAADEPADENIETSVINRGKSLALKMHRCLRSAGHPAHGVDSNNL